MFHIGPHMITGKAILAPMAGVSDRAQRKICLEKGAAYAVGEMLISDTKLWNSQKSRSRLSLSESEALNVVQIAGAEPDKMAEAATRAQAHGASIIDINMGCPAKKVCNKASGSALLRDEALVASILDTVVRSCDIPVTLKYRTGWSSDQKNACHIGELAESLGVKALTLHGRTRECRFKGEAEYDTIAELKRRVSIPVIANGDITSAAKAKAVLAHTQADAVMIGRAAQGNPWIFSEINAAVDGKTSQRPKFSEIKATILMHLSEIYALYGEIKGCRIARKHIAWYLERPFFRTHAEASNTLRQSCNRITESNRQLKTVRTFFEQIDLLEELAA